ncbi:Gfo/Idh/MocA family oxidoreductase [Microbacterium sp. EYE_5]|uniref:Gfo/Idh/MocA family protein n=1 Tax=unclassified Microbacterium TaxID=2609290 RepID=UPI00200637D3|nr:MULTISPECIES: Gfo/Idh/MocA family oxidoreductase [unclassified Microbacterium]MCK6079851.1 Gfo/Idh/MocA family oxidoreductase [Microbacterium sp. EYE_382]MCK6085122.1 Gfo/Idh/MocA family oxidoreductase [Microbacterium sp. EYE_384]MCK6122652.1 Gfo/Idh/MocA family oxidoreductase [Microbacterium sp. EYE_80]MCK6125885.1 Gfo/Idh/MocA family oxidoreductase [Microbacterium sp. EYE_79]MCK6140806.1 Gfo/Idh/MocA family oxidoreductase [Microbacterium sp. EYE_39]
MNGRLNVAVIGAGYWGPNLARNLRASRDWNLAAICDLDIDRARKVADAVGGAPVTSDLESVLSDPMIDAVAVATPARTHHRIVLAALDAGKHVMVEKPLADSRDRGGEMVRRAQEQGLVLMADHTYCYTPAVLKMRELVAKGALGDILFVDSVRINLGLIQPDVDVFWDLAPHDLSIMDFVLPGGLAATSVSAHGSDPLGTGKSCIGYMAMPLECGAMAHVHVNWLSPTKIRRMVIGGTRRTLVWDDLNPQQRLSVYDRGVDVNTVSKATAKDRRAANVSYRLGDTWAPALEEREALGGVVTEFAAAIRERRASRTSGAAGLRVLSVLDAAAGSLAAFGAPHPVPRLVPAEEVAA